MRTVNFTITRGEVWERLVVIKDKRTRRKRVPVEVAAAVRLPDGDYYLPTEVTAEGGIKLYLNPQQTAWLEDGEYRWDIVAIVSRSALLTSTPFHEQVVLTGNLTVKSYDNIAPMSYVLEPLEPLTGVDW